MAGDNDQSSSTQSTKTKSDESKPADTSIVTQSIAVESQAEKAVEGKTITTASSEIAPPNSKATSIHHPLTRPLILEKLRQKQKRLLLNLLQLPSVTPANQKRQ